ncbi:MAG: dihydrofolate reductase family protein [Acidimicrobiales bacterium]
MSALIYGALSSLDGFVSDPSGSFDWAAPDDELMAAVNDLESEIGTFLYGRRMYETMRYWETADPDEAEEPLGAEFARNWLSADKIVFSTTLSDVTTARTKLLRTFDPEAIAEMKSSATRNLSVNGPTLASAAFKARLVDECHLFLQPVVVGAGLRTLPVVAPLRLELINERRFTSGALHLHYRVKST